MYLIDRYELTLPGHQRLVDARSALNYLERLVNGNQGEVEPQVLIDHLQPLIEALNDAADDAEPVNGQDQFMRQACEWDYIALSPAEKIMLQDLRCCSDEGKQDVYRVIAEVRASKPLPDLR